MYGYGGFSVSLLPTFSVSWLAFLTQFAHYPVLAVPNIRGGGEYGEKWHKDGSLDKKQNCFDDFIWASKYLCSAKYTAPSLIAINGGSNGGLLVGASILKSPSSFGCAVADVGYVVVGWR